MSNTTSINKVYLVCRDIDCGYHVLEAYTTEDEAITRLQYLQKLYEDNANEFFIEEKVIGEVDYRNYLGKLAKYIVPYGSCVYETSDKDSDADFYVITEEITLDNIVEDDKTQYKFINKNDYQEALDNQDIQAIEVYFCSNYLARGSIHDLQQQFNYKIDKQKIRHAFSQKSSNSWVKCKKKLTVEVGEERVGLKSLFHSFRILYFGIQLCEHGKIVDYTQANHIYHEIMKIGPDWKTLEIKFKPLYNALSTKFKKVAPK